MEYTIKEVAEILDLSEKEVEENIRRGILVARWEGGEWIIPEWGVRVFRRTKNTLEKIARFEDTESYVQNSEEILDIILEKLSSLADVKELVDSFLELYLYLQHRIYNLEQKLSGAEAKISELASLREHERRLYEENLALLKDRITELERQVKEVLEGGMSLMSKDVKEESGANKTMSMLTQVSASGDKEGFWSRFLRMLTWD